MTDPLETEEAQALLLAHLVSRPATAGALADQHQA